MRFLLFLLVLLLPVQVFAGNGTYIKGNVGIFMVEDSTLNFETGSYDADIGNVISETGFGLTAAIGKSGGNFDIELEFGYREAYLYGFDGEVFNFNGKDLIFADKDLDGTLKMKTLMTNIIYNFNNATIITPYIGAGVGVAWVDVEQFDDRGFAYQFLMGLEAHVLKDTSFLFGYRYLGVNHISQETTRGLDSQYYAGEDSVTIDSHNLELGLKYSF